MTSKRTRILIIVLFSLFFIILAAGLTAYFFYKSFKKPRVIYAHHTFIFDKGMMQGSSTLAVKNDNKWQIRIDSLSYSLQINGKIYLNGKKKNPIVLRAFSIDTFVLPYI